ncbi:MAG: hypothetical protein ACFFC6_18310, partial [Promethearchaeota archaeon]
NYVFNDITKSRKRLRFFHISRDSNSVNHRLTLVSKIVVLVYVFILIVELNRNPEVLTSLTIFLERGIP